MKKIFLILVIVTGFGITAQAQDIILKKPDASEIKAKVLEITDDQIKYKEFDFQDGPTRNINISEVFMIIYENGKIEFFKKFSKQQKITNCAKKTAFGLDIGNGGSFYTPSNILGTSFAPALGIRVMHHFNPYFGIDFFKINWITDLFTSGWMDPWTMRLQIMPGIRGNSPTFFKCMSGYAAFRLGYGMDFRVPVSSYIKSNFQGLCLETELGVNLTPAVFAGFAYNYQEYFGRDVKVRYSKLAMHTFSFRAGFNFGKLQETKKREIVSKQREVENEQITQPIQRKKVVKLPKDHVELKRDGVSLLGTGVGLLGLGTIFMCMVIGTDDPQNYTVGSVCVGIGGALTIASIPVLTVASARKKAASYTYQPTLNLNYTGNGLGIALKL